MSNAKLIASRKWTGDVVFKECKAQGLVPMFKGDIFIEYRDRQTGRRAVTGLPSLNGVIGEEYTKALLEAEMGPKEEPKLKPETIRKAQVKPPTLSKQEKLNKNIRLLVKKNPRKEGTKVWKSFQVYFAHQPGALSVADYLKHPDAGMNHLNWDRDLGYIELYD